MKNDVLATLTKELKNTQFLLCPFFYRAMSGGHKSVRDLHRVLAKKHPTCRRTAQ